MPLEKCTLPHRSAVLLLHWCYVAEARECVLCCPTLYGTLLPRSALWGVVLLCVRCAVQSCVSCCTVLPCCVLLPYALVWCCVELALCSTLHLCPALCCKLPCCIRPCAVLHVMSLFHYTYSSRALLLRIHNHHHHKQHQWRQKRSREMLIHHRRCPYRQSDRSARSRTAYPLM